MKQLFPLKVLDKTFFEKIAFQNFEDAAAFPTEMAYLLRGIGIVYLHSEKPRHLQISGYVTLL
jgi:hypothetical protein